MINCASQWQRLRQTEVEIRSASENAHMNTLSQDALHLTSCVTILANHLVNSAAVQLRMDEHKDMAILPINDSIDCIANNKIMSTRDLAIEVDHRFKWNIHKQRHPIEEVTTTTCTKIFKSKSKASILPSLKKYSKIAEDAYKIVLSANVKDIELAGILRAISNGIKIEHTTLDAKQIKFITDLSTLLFSEEPQRNVASYITNHMFIDLIEWGKLTFKDLPQLLPMAITQAVISSRTLDYEIFTPIKRHSPYDACNTRHTINSNKVTDLIARSNNIIKTWLIQAGVTEEILQQAPAECEHLQHIVNVITHKGIARWYGTGLDSLPTLDQNEITSIINPPKLSTITKSHRYCNSGSLLYGDENEDNMLSFQELALQMSQDLANSVLGDTYDSKISDGA